MHQLLDAISAAAAATGGAAGAPPLPLPLPTEEGVPGDARGDAGPGGAEVLGEPTVPDTHNVGQGTVP